MQEQLATKCGQVLYLIHSTVENQIKIIGLISPLADILILLRNRTCCTTVLPYPDSSRVEIGGKDRKLRPKDRPLGVDLGGWQCGATTDLASGVAEASKTAITSISYVDATKVLGLRS